MDITIASVAEMLNQTAAMFAPELQTKARLGLELEGMITQRQTTGEYYVVENAEATELLQPYQGTFTPKGSVTHNETKIRVRPVKIDLEITEVQLEKWYNSWMISRMEAGKSPLEWTYPRYILERELLPKFNDDLNNAGWNGIYAAPTPGTAGDAVDSVNGFKKVIADLVTDSAVNVYSTSTITSSNIREKVEEFLDSIPDHITKKGGRILMAPKHRRWYFRDYRSEFTQINTTFPGNDGGSKEIMVDDYMVTLESVATMTGSDRWIFLPNGRDNMVWVSRLGYPVYPNFEFDTAPRTLQLYGTIYRGFGFEYPKEVWVNDQV